MQPFIIAMSGRKGAGKNTLSTFIQNWFCQEQSNVEQELRSVMSADYVFKGVSDSTCMECSFADTLKDFCIETLGLDRNQCYGTDAQKNSPTAYSWEKVPDFLRWKFGSDQKAKDLVLSGATTNKILEEFYSDQHPKNLKSGSMTGREIMQIFGTDLIRQTFGNVWADATIRRINQSQKLLAIITDNRFPNEINSILKEPRGFIIRLTRSPFGTEDIHPSESALDDFDWRRDKCYVLDNATMDIDQQNAAVIPILREIFNH